MTDPAGFQFGDTAYPLPAQTANTSLLTVCDPALDALILFLKWRINSCLGTALTGATSAGTPPIAANVQATMSLDPLENCERMEQFPGWPLFAMWRKSSTFAMRTNNWLQEVCTLGWAYCLPPTSLGYAQKYAHVLKSVVNIIAASLSAGRDPGYLSGARVLDTYNIADAVLTRCEYGKWEIGEGTGNLFHAVYGEMQISEGVVSYSTGMQTLTGIDTSTTDESVEPNNPIEVTAIKTEL